MSPNIESKGEGEGESKGEQDIVIEMIAKTKADHKRKQKVQKVKKKQKKVQKVQKVRSLSRIDCRDINLVKTKMLTLRGERVQG